MSGFLRRASLPCAWSDFEAGTPLNLAGARFEDEQQVATRALRLNGAGLRVRLMFAVYALGLYLAEPARHADTILNDPAPKRLRLVMLRELDGTQLFEALEDGLRRNLTGEELKALARSMDTLGRALAALGPAPLGTVLELDWLPGVGTRLMVDRQRIAAEIDEPCFYAALLRIWLGADPVDPALKRCLLGEPAHAR